MILLYHTGVGGRGGPGSGGTPSACSGRARPPVASTPRTQAPGLDREHEVLPLQKAARPMDRTIRAPVQYTPAAPLHSMRTKRDRQRVVMREGTAMVRIARSDLGRGQWEQQQWVNLDSQADGPITSERDLDLRSIRAYIPRHARVRRVVDADSDGLSPRPRDDGKLVLWCTTTTTTTGTDSTSTSRTGVATRAVAA
ncbi:hypothetical protein DFH94DRAFT_848435 [Russula ochroleuca]|uniref:Uncharacterized protein n=1 Tax=Russula ochroleuca TaxID=152965 RepID=A0A9P5MNW6_9AGAM|nr:hypothetical protein DFH94DRAFT_848435 [Russula ochroleuca]